MPLRFSMAIPEPVPLAISTLVLERRIASMFGRSVGYVIVFLQLALSFLELGLFRDFVRQVRFQLALEVFPDLLLVLSLRAKRIEGVGGVEVCFFPQGKG